VLSSRFPEPLGVPRRVAVVAGTGRYEYADEWSKLDHVEEALQRVYQSLQAAGYRPATGQSYVLNPNREELKELLGSLPEDVNSAIVYYRSRICGRATAALPSYEEQYQEEKAFHARHRAADA
jgi:hypothetical protein